MLFYSTVDPIAFTLGPLTLRWYGLLFSLGFILGYFIMQYLFRKKGYNTSDLDRLLVYIFVGTVVGARLGHCLVYEPDFYLSHPLEILFIWHGGLASHGGTLGVLLAIFLFVRKSPYRFLELGDLLTIPVALVATLIRIGNFMNSEILGVPTGGDFGVVFLRLGETFPRYPAQLMESAAYFLTFIILSVLYLKKGARLPEGCLFALFFFFIFTSRFFIEPFKEEQADYSTGSIFTVGQMLSVPFIVASVILLIYVIRRQRHSSSEN